MMSSPHHPGSAGSTAATPDQVIRSLAARQHGVVSRAQLVGAGVSPRIIEHRLSKGYLEPLHRGVYRAGPAPARREREMAAVLACGPEAVLSHASAGVEWKLLPRVSPSDPVEVSTRVAYRQPGPGIRLHRVSTLTPNETTILDGVPITTPARTILDLASFLKPQALEGALARAERRSLVDRDGISHLLAGRRWLRGAPALRAILARGSAPAFTRSEAEDRFLQLIRRAHLPAPETNWIVEGYEVDFVWRSGRLVAEVDGFEFHSSRAAFEGDRERDAALMAAGFRVLRVTWRQLARAPEMVVARLRRALERTDG